MLKNHDLSDDPNVRGIHQGNWFWIAGELYKETSLGDEPVTMASVLGPSVLVYVALASMANTMDQNCHPSYAVLSKHSGLSPSSIQKAIKKLVDHGLISSRARKDDSGRSLGNLYTLLPISSWKIEGNIDG